MTQKSNPGGFKTFFTIWFGQLVSLTGSGLTGFALGVWVYQRTGSVTQFALISLVTMLPGILFSPIAGALVDRWDRRKVMILSDAGAGVCTLGIAVLFLAGSLEIWHIYLLMGISSSFSAFQWPAYSAAISLLVPKGQLGRANGMVQLSEAAAAIIAPVLAGTLMGVIHIQGIILLDFATFLLAVSTLLIVRVPKPTITIEGKAGKGSLLREAASGWTYIRARHGLLGLLIFFAFSNFTMGIVQVLFTPLVLSFSNPSTLGLILSIAGIGFLSGSLMMSAWGGPKRRIIGILVAHLLMGMALFLAIFPYNAWILGVAAFLVFFCSPVSSSCSQVIWQSKTAPDIQGRVFAMRRMIAWSSLPLAYLLAGPLADKVFEPMLTEGGLLAGSVGRIMGIGPGRGIAFIFMLMGFILLLATLVGYLYPRLRNVEKELPDFIPDQPLNTP